MKLQKYFDTCRVCVCVCVCISRIYQKVIDGFEPNFVEWETFGQGPIS